MAFKEDGARDWQDQLVISLNHSSTQNKLQFHHIFPKAVLEKKKSDLPSQKINDICNLVFISGSTNRRISNKEPSIYLPDFIDKIGVGELQKQCVPSDQSLWKVDDYESFLTKRRELIAEKLNKFIGHDQWGLSLIHI